MRPVHGGRQVISVRRTADANTVLATAVDKFKAHDKAFDASRPWRLYYPDGFLVHQLPESPETFSLQSYKDQLMRDYQRIVLFVGCPGK